MSEAKLLAAEKANTVILKVQGRATFKIAPVLRNFGAKAFDRGARTLMLDLADCSAMDSTFMGVIAMLALSAREKTNRQVMICNASEHNRQLLEDIGVSGVVTILQTPAPPGTSGAGEANLLDLKRAEPGDMDEAGRTILEAHEILMDLDEGNISKFRDVVELLRKEVNPENNDAGLE